MNTNLFIPNLSLGYIANMDVFYVVYYEVVMKYRDYMAYNELVYYEY